MPAAIKSGLWTALWTFIGLFSITVLSWLQQVVDWVSKADKVPFPGISALGYGAIAAAAAAASGFVAFVVRFGQSKGWIPGTPPSFPGKKA